MTARTQLVPVSLARDSFVTEAAASSAVAGGMYIQGVNASSPASTVELSKLFLRFIIGSTATVVTIRATGNGNDFAGNAQPAFNPANTVFTQSTAGDLVSASTTSAVLDAGPLSSDRFIQVDASGNTYYYIDFSQVTTVTVLAYLRPFNLV
jgi:hypothetical protein